MNVGLMDFKFCRLLDIFVYRIFCFDLKILFGRFNIWDVTVIIFLNMDQRLMPINRFNVSIYLS